MRTYRKKEPNFFQKIFTSQAFWLVVSLTVLILIAVPLYNNWQQRQAIDREIAEIKEEIAKYENSNKELDKMIQYLNSEESLEAKARSNLGLKRPGEQVVVIKTEEDEGGVKINNNNNNNEEISNPKRWFRYFVN
jgi:cell division protein FtsB